MDPLQWKLFRLHIRLHSADIGDEWKTKERAIDGLLDKVTASRPLVFDKIFLKLVKIRYILRQLRAGNRKPVKTAFLRPYLRSARLMRHVLRPTRSSVDPLGFSCADPAGRKRIGLSNVAGKPRSCALLDAATRVQSTVANESDPAGLHVAGPGVYNFNFFDRKLYAARRPLLGATPPSQQFLLLARRDLLVQRGNYDNVRYPEFQLVTGGLP